MIRLAGLFSSVCILIWIWHECGENPAFFCYRIGNGAFKTARARVLAPVPISSATNSSVRKRTSSACSTSSSTFSVISITQKH
jgi:hypothetical protein